MLAATDFYCAFSLRTFSIIIYHRMATSDVCKLYHEQTLETEIERRGFPIDVVVAMNPRSPNSLEFLTKYALFLFMWGWNLQWNVSSWPRNHKPEMGISKAEANDCQNGPKIGPFHSKVFPFISFHFISCPFFSFHVLSFQMWLREPLERGPCEGAWRPGACLGGRLSGHGVTWPTGSGSNWRSPRSDLTQGNAQKNSVPSSTQTVNFSQNLWQVVMTTPLRCLRAGVGPTSYGLTRQNWWWPCQCGKSPMRSHSDLMNTGRTCAFPRI